MTDDRLTEYCHTVQGILLANNFTIGTYKSIAFGLQFSLTREDKSGLMRIYQRQNGTFTLDFSPIKDPELLHSVRHLLEKKPPAARIPANSIPAITARQPITAYDVGYPVIGTDESGKGDYFGPLVCAAVCVDEPTADALRSIGVRDSKTCTDPEIKELAEKIQELCAGKFEIIEFSPEKYNKLYEELTREGKNLNTMLAWGHAKVIEELLNRVDCNLALADKFGNERLILGKLQAKGRTIRLIQMHRAEQNIAVAAASILARARFVERIAAQSQKYSMTFPLGASAAVIRAGKQFIAKCGLPSLPLVAKMHFRTTEEVRGKNH
ncbi:MAG: ribonuclease HIII [Methanoregula sp.]|nr:ribonuclease HIII [Methanoregula sp.]